MEIVGIILIVAAAVLMLVGGIWFLIAAFSESVLWGVACLLLPIVNLFFLIVHWDKARKPFFLQLLAIALFILAFFVLPPQTHH